jgi:dolichol-phosphate mannosyltransferase
LTRLSQQGFKILLDIFVSARAPLRYAEVACRFGQRLHGESKLDAGAAWDFGMLIIDKLLGGVAPVQFIMFCMVGGSGLVVHLLTLFLATRSGVVFVTAQTLAVIVAMTWNFFLNNLITYRDRRLRGAAELARGLISFYAVCAIGAAANVGVAELVFKRQGVWWTAGVAGAVIGVVWNFAASRYVTWRRKAIPRAAG